MQRSSQTVHGCAERQVGVRQSTAHQVAGVGTDIASLVVTGGGKVGRKQDIRKHSSDNPFKNRWTI